MKLVRLSALVISSSAFVALAACGGGGGSSSTPPVTSPSTNPGSGSTSVSTPPPNATALATTITTSGTVRPVNGGDNDFSPTDGNTSSGGQGSSVDGIPCLTTMPSNQYHRHNWLGILVQGKEVAIPDAIGFVGDAGDDANGFSNYAHCFYYIHTHDSSGYIHIEPDSTEQYTLKNLFDIWGQTLAGGTNGQVGPFTGQVRAFVAQAPSGGLTASSWSEFTGDPNTIPLNSHHTAIMLEVGPPFVEATSLPPVVFYTED